MSEKTSSVLKEEGGYHLEYRGLTKIKGKGEMETYWLLGKEGFKKELPVPPELGLVNCNLAQKFLLMSVTEEDCIKCIVF